MNTINKWIRQIHRWLVIPFALGLLLSVLAGIIQGENAKTPDALTFTVIISIFTLAITGLYMFIQHYLAKWKRSQRSTR